MKRRAFMALVSASLLVAPLAAEAQQAKAVPRVAFLGNGSTSASGPLLDSFRVGLRELGYVEGQSIVIESRFADGKQERVPGLVRELLERPDGRVVDCLLDLSLVSLRCSRGRTTELEVEREYW